MENLFFRRTCSSFSKSSRAKNGVTRWRPAGPRRPAPTSGQGPADVDRTQPQTETKYNEFHGGVSHTFQLPLRSLYATSAAGGPRQPARAAHRKEATVAGANSISLGYEP